MAQAKLGETDPEGFLSSMKIDKLTLKSIVDSIRVLLKPFRHNITMTFVETNEVLDTIKLEIEIKNIR